MYNRRCLERFYFSDGNFWSNDGTDVKARHGMRIRLEKKKHREGDGDRIKETTRWEQDG